MAVAVTYAIIIGGLATLAAILDRHESLARAQIATGDLAALTITHTTRTLAFADQLLLRLGECAARNSCDLGGMLASASPLANLYWLDGNGRLVADARNFHAPGTDFSDRDWVVAAKAGNRSVMGGGYFDEASRSFVFTLARPLADGKGFAAATIDANDLDKGMNVSLALHGTDGSVLLGPPVGLDRIKSSSASDAYPVVAWVGVDTDEALAQWRSRTYRLGVIVVAGFGVMMVLAWVSTRGWAKDRGAARSLAALNRDLERSNADLEQFAYIASHDLKEPLRNISSYVQLLQRRYQGKLDPDADAFIGYTVDGVRRMQAIINELLTYSRVGTGKLDLATVSAGAAVTTALAQLKTVISEAQAAVEIKGPMPVINADPAQLASLFQNLIGNAVKYRSPEIRPEITVAVEDLGREWRFSVADNGIGIESEYHGQIFDLFKRLHPRDHYSGTGIGLALCKRVVERHGGRIGVTSEIGRGSTFWFILPKAEPVKS